MKKENNTTLFAIFILLLLILFVALFYLFQGKSPKANLANPKGDNFSYRENSQPSESESPDNLDEYTPELLPEIEINSPNIDELETGFDHTFSGTLLNSTENIDNVSLVCKWEYFIFDEEGEEVIDEGSIDEFEDNVMEGKDEICNFTERFDISGRLRVVLTTSFAGYEDSISTEREYNLIAPVAN